ncbi:hypothetical protein H0H87_006569 [Tephrocybe sp. NHM501043]|nr:hypothetical protein H0H87_006569 [Tephrocybe sp. NHM501043]
MVIMWPNEDGTTTLSHRKALGHTEPLPAEYPPRRAVIAEPRVSTLWHPKAVKTLAFTIPINKTVLSWRNPTERLIWAYGKVRPEKPDYSELTQHYIAGFLRLNLGGTMPDLVPTVEPAPHIHQELPEVPGETTPNTVINTPPESSHKKHEKVIIAHGLLGSIGFLVLLPCGVLSARWGRTFTSKWLIVHKTINMSVAFFVITLGWMLGVAAAFDHYGSEQTPHFLGPHQARRFLLSLSLPSDIDSHQRLQVALGRYIHHRKTEKALPETAQPHPPSNILHVVLGLAIIAIAFAQVRSGMKEWKMATGDTHIAHWCHVLWNAWAITVPVAYLVGMILIRRQFYQESHGLKPGNGPYSSISPGRPIFEIAFNDTDDELPSKPLSGQVASELAKSRSEGTVPLLSDRRT